MSLTTGRGPLGTNPAGRFSTPIPLGVVYVEPYWRRVRATLGGRTVLDSERGLLVHRPGLPPAFAFPVADVHGLVTEPVPEAPGHVQVAWEAVDTWYEEDEQLVGRPRNPYHRVDCLRTHRRLHVEVASEVLVDTTDTLALFETGLAPKLYVARGSVRTELLVPSPTTTFCAYKGVASWWSAAVGDLVVDDVAWSYEEPIDECPAIRGLLSFDPDRVLVDAELPPMD